MSSIIAWGVFLKAFLGLQYVGEETQIEFSALLVEKTEITVQKGQSNNYLRRKVPEVRELHQYLWQGRSEGWRIGGEKDP